MNNALHTGQVSDQGRSEPLCLLKDSLESFPQHLGLLKVLGDELHNIHHVHHANILSFLFIVDGCAVDLMVVQDLDGW